MKSTLNFGGLLLAWSYVTHAATITPAQISSEIASYGAKAVVQNLYRDGRFDQVLEDIAAGQSVWIRLAPDLTRGADAAASEELIIALARALPNNSRAVLEVLDAGSVIHADAVCGVPFIEPTSREIAVYLERAIPAVKAVRKSTQPPLGEACLRTLLRAEKLINSR